ncbi:SGNH/GDSL hydrolase family protein [Bremerella sp. JC817]|uniref:SGNH/GDSL hydrolase family protein n=1 Tax=Bremerella sp. JC817 TaxID=3231756 RepID=UPI00345A9F6A
MIRCFSNPRFAPFCMGIVFACLSVTSALAQFGSVGTPTPYEIHDGDRIALVGGTFIEREQQYGYFELALQLSLPETNFSIRNLGWSGDTATGIARARFGNQQEGWSHLTKSLDLVNPTVIFVCYGTNEAFEGEKGLEAFKANYGKLLDELEKRTKRIVMILPLPMENLGEPLPNPEQYNQNVELYSKAISEIAYDRGHPFVNASKAVSGYKPQESGDPAFLTDNGLHLTGYGYWKLAPVMTSRIGLSPKRSLTTANPASELEGGKAVAMPIPYPRSPLADNQNTITYAIHFLNEGEHSLQLDDQPKVTATAKQWAEGVDVPAAPLTDRAEELREAILRKNQLFFDRYRPQNETYLYLFRKHEQGNNAVEIPQFDPLVEAQDKKIFELKQPMNVKVQLD